MKVFEGTSPDAKSAREIWHGSLVKGVVENSAPVRIFFVDIKGANDEGCSAFDGFDEFVDEIESVPEGRVEIAEARKWVGTKFYADSYSLAGLRLAAGLSQRQLAEMCGMEQPHVSRLESGRHEPQLSLAIKLAKALSVSIDVFSQAWANTRAEFDAPKGDGR